jgi:hypothetical protein
VVIGCIVLEERESRSQDDITSWTKVLALRFDSGSDLRMSSGDLFFVVSIYMVSEVFG